MTHSEAQALRFPGHQMSWVSESLIEWLTTRFFFKYCYKGSPGGGDDAGTSTTRIAQRKRAITHSTMKNNHNIIEGCNNTHQGRHVPANNVRLRFRPLVMCRVELWILLYYTKEHLPFHFHFLTTVLSQIILPIFTYLFAADTRHESLRYVSKTVVTCEINTEMISKLFQRHWTCWKIFVSCNNPPKYFWSNFRASFYAL